MEATAALDRLRRGLREVLRTRSFTFGEASELVGRHPNYLSRVLSGELALKVREIFELLAMVEADCELFLEALFPFGSPTTAQAPSDSGLHRLIQLERSQRGEVLTPEHLEGKARRILKDTLRRKRCSQRVASLAQSLRPHTLSLALTGNTRLTWELVFGTLAACKTSPGRFVMDLFGAPEDDLYDRLRWSQHLDELEAVFLDLDRGPGEAARKPWLPAPAARA